LVNKPELRARAFSPSGVWISLCARAGAPPDTRPTRRTLTPSASCFLITSPPRKSHASRRRLPIVQVRPASTGVISSFRSLPAPRAHLVGAGLLTEQP